MRDEADVWAWEGEPEQARRGSSMGNADCFLRADAEANLDGFWLAANNRWYTGELSARLLSPSGFRARRVRYAPAYQAAFYENEAGAVCEKRLFVAASGAHVTLWLRFSSVPVESSIAILCDWRVCAARSEAHRQQPGRDCERPWKAAAEAPQTVSALPWDEEGDGLTLQASHPFSDFLWTEPARARLTFSVSPDAEGSLDFWLCLTCSADASLLPNTLPPDAQTAFAEAQQALADIAGEAREQTPIARAVAWGKIGSWRVWHRYGTGDWGFNNDPPGNLVVTRDAAWFLFGTDHFAPTWSRALLATLTRHAVYPSGKIAEYVCLGTSGVTQEDYGLNLNDATPLFLLAVEHHWRAMRKSGSGAEEAAVLSDFYPAARGAAEWILQQRREEGLVWCDGRGRSAWGTGSWRNIIPGYRLAGAVTELNALCVAALRAAASLAAAAGEAANHQRFAEAAAQGNDAMAQLVDPQTGLFLLTRDENGPNPHLTIDLAIPALFDVGPEEARVRTLLRLVEEDFRGPHGVRTLSKNDPAYHPRFGWGLMGGSWPNATAWTAAALAPYRPELAWELVEQIARALFPETRTASGVSVPGQFPEWFDGDTGESSGMSLSPWMPATFVWLVQEGMLRHLTPGPSP